MNKLKSKIIEKCKSLSVILLGALIILFPLGSIVVSIFKFPCRAYCWMGTSLFFIVSGALLIVIANTYQRRMYIKTLTIRQLKILGEQPENLDVNHIVDCVFRERVFPTQKNISILLVVIGLVLGLVPYQNWEGAYGVLDFISILRQTMQMFVVDGGINDFIQDSSKSLPDMLNGINDKILLLFNIYTAIMCVVAGLLFTFKLIDIFAKEFKAYFDYWWVHPFSDIYVMSELNEKSIALAESIFLRYYRKGTTQKLDSGLAKHVRIYFCDVYSDNKERGAELISRAKRLDAVVMKRDIAGIKIKSCCHSNKFYLIGAHEEENVEQAQQICASNEPIKLTKPLDVFIYATRQESEFIIDNMHNKKRRGKNEEQNKKDKRYKKEKHNNQ